MIDTPVPVVPPEPTGVGSLNLPVVYLMQRIEKNARNLFRN
jgi:hypothetical protein